MNGEKKKKAKRNIVQKASLAILFFQAFWMVPAAEEMEMGGFEVEIGVGEQQGIPEDFDNMETTEEIPMPESLQEEVFAEEPPAEEVPIEEVQTEEVLEEGIWAETPVQDTSVEEQILGEMQDPVPTIMSLPTETPIPTVTPIPAETPIPTVTPLPTKTPIPVPSEMPEFTLAPAPSVTPQPAVTPAPTPFPAVLHKIFVGNDEIPSVRVQCRGAVQIFSFRVNEKECSWKWNEDMLSAITEPRKGKNKLELLLVSPCGEKMTLSRGR
jgi:hypothetical protein